MLTKDQKNYLKTIPPDKRVNVRSFNKRLQKVANEIIQSIRKIYPNLAVLHMGASALGIAGQEELDIYVLVKPLEFDKYLQGLIKLFGNSLHRHKTFIEWNFMKDGYTIELYLTDPDSKTMRQQIKVFETLKNNKKLLSQYEQLKKSMDGKSLKEYQKKKYEFFNKILKE